MKRLSFKTMKTIEIIEPLKLGRKGLLARDNSGKWVQIHHKQGDMDGACAVYCLMMDLLILGYISEEDVCIYNTADRRSKRGKFISHFLEEQGLIRTGYTYSALAKELRFLCGDDLKVQRKNPRKTDDRLILIADSIETDLPVIISVDFENGGGHALLAVGVELGPNQDIRKILCLDPGATSPEYAEWNCFIDVSKDNGKDFPFWYVTEKGYHKVMLGDMISIERV